MRHKSKNRRWSLLWRTIFLLTLFVIISQVIIYAWVQRSVSGHFEQMDSEILTHAAFNLRKRMVSLEDHIEPFTVSKSQALIDANHLHSSWLDYDLKTLVSDKNGKLLSSDPSNFINDLPADFSLLQLLQDYRDQQFMIKINNRHYRAIIITHQEVLAFIALPIDVHNQYLIQFNRQLSLILIAITLLLVSVAALSVHWGFAPLATIVQKMKGINLQRLDERIVVGDMPLELRPLTESYNSMMVKLESNFESLSRFSDNIAHELRTPIATLSTQTQVMLTKPRESDEYIEQLHHQHDTLKQLSAMINDMLLLAKTQKELSDSQISHVDIESLITKLIDYYEMIAEDREIIFEKSGDFKTVLGDKGLLQRLFANLMSNAIYYAASNSTIMISATVLTSSTSLNAPKDDIQSPEQLWLRITMTNRLDKPLNQIEADKLFERFYRHDKTNTMHSGTGLGLSIVQAIANAHNGKVSITIKDECLFEVAVKLLIAR
ncbi:MULTISPECIES: ATP-binding protein [Psychrobacter]|jgi:two-component system heavy metal sensor histidine kinase CusS|uniref:ATP-binding protein n=1 Tax=Psychrobacter TaxID=497 RepID=UPI0007124C97|nr:MULTISPECIES: ATP-binding protein [Psychrobacter]KRG31938.1 histidine kinase [Psychrobacter sp. P11F6]MDN3453118.1 ATP-binding protein [Psychrobacter sp. APC 3350]MDN3502970.1 ATP-binding protein [Psychrobacter sp. 5A.1]NYR10718.1 sensor histidine kinase [Psychrobacter sp. BI730]